MWQVVSKHLKLILFIAVFGMLISIFLTDIWANAVAKDSSENTDTSELLRYLKARTQAEPGFVVAIKFSVPILEGDSQIWEIPDSSLEGDFWRQFGEIGKDFVCFDERAGSSFGTRCVTFSNIVAIMYFDDP